MANYVSLAPLWVIVLFIVSFLFSTLLIANPAKKAALDVGMPEKKARNIQIGIFVFYLTWLIYASALALLGVLDKNTLPPRVFVFTTIILFVILFGYIGNTQLFKKLLRSISLESLVRLHIFRLVGIFFIVLYFYHLLPFGFAVSAAMGDIITALIAWPVSKWVANRKPWARIAVIAWNIFGMLDIINLVTIAVIGAIKGETGNSEMIHFPFVWFPAFAPATILFLHTAVFRKLRQLKPDE